MRYQGARTRKAKAASAPSVPYAFRARTRNVYRPGGRLEYSLNASGAQAHQAVSKPSRRTWKES